MSFMLTEDMRHEQVGFTIHCSLATVFQELANHDWQASQAERADFAL